MYLLFGYPALVIGILAGVVVGRRRWPVLPVLAIGALVFLALVLRQSTVPQPPALLDERTRITPPIWALFALVNIGAWALGVGIGVVLDSRFSSHRVS
jgi:hypothetical protein